MEAYNPSLPSVGQKDLTGTDLSANAKNHYDLGVSVMYKEHHEAVDHFIEAAADPALYKSAWENIALTIYHGVTVHNSVPLLTKFDETNLIHLAFDANVDKGIRAKAASAVASNIVRGSEFHINRAQLYIKLAIALDDNLKNDFKLNSFNVSVHKFNVYDQDFNIWFDISLTGQTFDFDPVSNNYGRGGGMHPDVLALNELRKLGEITEISDNALAEFDKIPERSLDELRKINKYYGTHG